jgi:phage terminase large subunit-like protein
VLQAAAPDIFVRLVRASEGKRARAEPIATFYAQGRVKHAAAFPALEDEMCAFGAEGFKDSPDRLDALVWAMTDLLMGGAQPRLRLL